ncbi:MAG: protein kinase, partial [Myxococcota bacterium]
MGDERQADDIWRLAAGDRVDQFRVLRRLGKGGMGQVYAARDEQLGRRVALKLLTASETGTDALDEARTTAQFSHPHIVTLYAVGTYGELAYLALEYLEGETLRDRLRSGALPVQEALRLAHDIAEALKEAHRRDIQHRDLHPRNVFLGADGRLRVLDFGLSALGSPSTAEGRASGRIRGTPAYMAPEQWRGEALSPAVDVWALGLVLYELLTGTHPYAARELNSYEIRAQVLAEELRFEAPSQRREGVPRIVDDLVLECLSPEAPRRPAAAELVAQLGAMLTLSFSAPEQDPSPFKGLLTFTERDAARFYGREREVAAFVERLRKTSFLTVVGASGAGKSSFVQAGVIPRLREWGELVVVSMRPGRTPLQALVSALGTHVTAPLSGTTRSMEESELSAEVSLEGSEPESLASQLLRTPSKLSLFLQQLAERHGARAVLFVDQFEEVVTLTEDDAERSAFVKAVCLAAEDPALPVRVVLTLREEFLSRVQATMAERGGITQITVLRTPDTVDLRRILLQPVAEAQHRFDDEGVVDEMVAEASRSSACLPLLQFGGAKLWEGRDQSQRLLLRATYRDMGGLAGALAQHADQVLQAFGPDELPVGRALCLRLVTPQRTRRAVPRDELLEGLGEAGEQLLERFVAARLIVGRSGGEGPEGDLELVHESLIQTWARLAGWITQSSEELILLGELERASLGWERRGRRESDLWRGDALSDAVRSMRSFPGEVPPRVQAFLQESHDRERRVQRRTRGAVGATMLVLALAALGFARGQAEAERERGRAESERARAETGRAQVELEGARTAAERGRMVEAKAKLRASLETRDSLGGRWLWRTLRSEPRIWTLDLASTVLDVREDPLGRFVAVAVGPSVLLYDAATADGPRALAAPEMLERLAFSPGGSWLAGVTRFERTVEVWSLSGTEPLRRHLALEAPPEPGPGWSRTRLGWASDETLKVLKGAWLYTYDPRSGTLVHSEPLEKGDGVAFAVAGPLHARSDGRWLRFGGEARAPIELTSKVGNLALHPGRGRVAIGLKSGEVEVWDYVAGQRIWQTSGHARWVEELRFDASGDGLVTQAVDGVRVWRVGEPRPLESYGCEGRASGVDVDRGGDHVAIACRPGVVRRVALNVPTRDDVVVGHEAETTGPRFSPDGQYVLSGSLDRTTRLWSLSTGRNLSTPISHNSQIFNTAYGPRGRMYATAEQSGAIQLFDPQSERRLATLFGHTRGVLDLVFTADGQQLITSGQDGTLRRWSTETRTHLQTIDVGCSLYFAAVDDAGRVAASCYSEPRTVLFDAAGGARREVRGAA